MSTPKETILKTLFPLKGKRFKTKEDLEDAFLPYFATLQNYFQGEGHRALVDRLIAMNLIILDKHEYLVKLEDVLVIGDDLKDEISDTPEVTVPELQLLINICNGVPPAIFSALIKKGLIQISVTPLGKSLFSALKFT